MGEHTAIGWTDHTWSPWWGCTKVGPPCDHCYAEALDKRVGGDHWGPGKPRRAMSDNHWRQPLKWDRAAREAGERRFVFPSMCDPFDNEVDPAWRSRFFDLIRATPNLVWLLLTKRIGNAVSMSMEAGGLPANAALGATMANQPEYDRDRLKLQTAAAQLDPVFTFVSIEPMLGRVILDKHAPDWIIVGGESGPNFRPIVLDDVRYLRDQSLELKRTFFFKQVGGRTPKANGKELDGREWCDRPAMEAA